MKKHSARAFFQVDIDQALVDALSNRAIQAAVPKRSGRMVFKSNSVAATPCTGDI
jgi:hypothetical protein